MKWDNILEKVFDLLNIVFMVIVVILCFYPIYYMFIYSISSPEAASKGLILLPQELTLVNFISIFRTGEIVNGFIISVSRTLIGTVLTVICSSIVSYIITKDELPFKKFIYRFIVITMYLNAGLIPWYMTMVSYRLKNNFLLYVVPTMINVFFVILIKTYIEESIPISIEESARIDGAGLATTFFKIILPLSLPILAAVGLFSAVGQWNSWSDNLFLVSNPKLKTLQLTLYEYMTQTVPTSATSTREMAQSAKAYKPTVNSVRMTVAIITIIPILLVYPFVQKYFVKGLMIGAVKG